MSYQDQARHHVAMIDKEVRAGRALSVYESLVLNDLEKQTNVPKVYAVRCRPCPLECS